MKQLKLRSLCFLMLFTILNSKSTKDETLDEQTAAKFHLSISLFAQTFDYYKQYHELCANKNPNCYYRHVTFNVKQCSGSQALKQFIHENTLRKLIYLLTTAVGDNPEDKSYATKDSLANLLKLLPNQIRSANVQNTQQTIVAFEIIKKAHTYVSHLQTCTYRNSQSCKCKAEFVNTIKTWHIIEGKQYWPLANFPTLLSIYLRLKGYPDFQ